MPAKRKSPSGNWKVTLTRVFTLFDFTYRPGDDHTVDDATLALFEAEDGLVENAQPIA